DIRCARGIAERPARIRSIHWSRNRIRCLQLEIPRDTIDTGARGRVESADRLAIRLTDRDDDCSTLLALFRPEGIPRRIEDIRTFLREILVGSLASLTPGLERTLHIV